MKRLVIIAFLILSMNLFAQKRMVLIKGFQEHKIEASDSIAESTVREFYWWVYKHRIDYETKLLELKAVKTVSLNRNTLHYFRDSTIYINSYADDYPYSKRILILHELGKFYGARPTKGNSLDVMNEHFYLTDKYETKYKYRKSHFTDMKQLMEILESTSPLKTN